MANRAKFPVKVRKAAFDRSGGVCEECGTPFGKHPKTWVQYDHRIPDALGGDNSLENCRAICASCHAMKTVQQDIKMITKAARGERKRRGLEGRKAKLPGSKGSGWRHKMNGEWVRVNE